MRVIKESRVGEYMRQHARARTSLTRWLDIVKSAKWTAWKDVRRTFSHADQIVVRSGRHVVVFNIAGNDFRLITAIHYNMNKLFVLRFMTHVEYDKNDWKEQL